MPRRTLLALLCAAAFAFADEVSDQADAVVEALKSGDAERLRALAEAASPDPWIVADTLLERGDEEAAVAFAAAATGTETAALARYVASRRGKPPDGEAKGAFGEATAAIFAGHAEDALAILDRARAEPGELWHPRLELARGWARLDLHDFRGSIAAFERAAASAESLGWIVGSLWSLVRAGEAACDMGDYGRALAIFERHLALNRTRKKPADEAESLGNVGFARRRLGDYAGALSCFEQALKLTEEAGAKEGIARSLRQAAEVLPHFGRHADALRALERALEISRAAGDGAAVAETLNDLAIVRDELGDPRGAVDLLADVYRIAQEIKDLRLATKALDNAGNAYRTLGEYGRAIECQEEALRRYEAQGLAGDAARVRLNLGILHQILGDRPGAEALFGGAREIAVDVKDRPLEAAATLELAILARGVGDGAGEIPLLEQALRLYEAMGDEAGRAKVSANLALALSRRGEHGRALALNAEAMAFEERAGDREAGARLLGNKGFLLERQGEFAKALDCRLHAVADAEAVGALSTEVVNLWGSATSQLALGRPREALQAGHRAIERMPFLVGRLSDEQGARARGRWSPLFEAGTRAARDLGDPVEAFFFVESGRAMAFLESVRAEATLSDEVVPPALLEEERLATAAEAAAQRRLAGAPRDEEARTAWRAATNARRAVVERIQRSAKADLLYPTAAPMDRVRAACGEGDALVLYALLEDRALAIVVTAKGARLVDLCPVGQIEDACRRLRFGVGKGARGLSLEDSHTDPAAEIARVKELVWAPLGIEAKRLLISPDGALSQIPFALFVGSADVTCVPSGSAYVLLRDERGLRGQGVLALGNPDTRPADAVYAPDGLPSLPGSAREASAVGDKVLLKADATEGRLRVEISGRPRWRAVHFACHGIVRPDDPCLCALALAPDEGNDGFLTTLDVLRMKVPADLVVLSACETARGRECLAEGMCGLPRAFMVAGAPRVLASLWSVDDEATRLLFEKFYALWRDGSMGPAAALREAQLYVREWKTPAGEHPYAHPCYWAAWVLWGLPD